MPQLWTETIVTQYFWLVAILLGFYYIAVTQIIPQIAYTIKTRRELETASNVVAKETTSPSEINISNSKSLISNLLAIPSEMSVKSKDLDSVVQNNLSAVYTVKADWVKKYSN